MTIKQHGGVFGRNPTFNDVTAEGDVVVDGTANATNLTRGGSQVYSRDNILGTASESSGVPTGAIIERGSNANGEFVKYADGTQICTNVADFTDVDVTTAFGNLFRSGNILTASWPANFSSTPAVSTFTSKQNLFLQSGSTSPIKATGSFNFRLYSAGSSAASTGTATYFAIGRWY